MTYIVRIDQIEQAINVCKQSHPPSDLSLPADVRMMATVYGQMIYEHARTVDIDILAGDVASLFLRWLEAGAGGPDASPAGCPAGSSSEDGPAGACDVCQ
jgi:hypothetical protein